jgi:hypothetical protein
MRKAGSGGLILAAIILVFAGVLIRLDLLTRLLDLIGFVFIAGGVIVGIIGLIGMFTGGKSQSSDF